MSRYNVSISKYLSTKEKPMYRVEYSYISPIDGKKHNTCKHGFKLKKEAENWRDTELPKVIAQLEHIEILDENMTMAELIEKYKYHISLRLKETTCATKENIIDTKILPFFKNKVVHKITVKDIENWHNKLLTETNKQGEKYSDTYLRAMNSQLAAILNYAGRKHNLKENPMKNAEKIGSKEAEEREFWELDEYLKFREALWDKPMFYYAFEILFWCGLRIGEMLALTLEDIDLETRHSV